MILKYYFPFIGKPSLPSNACRDLISHTQVSNHYCLLIAQSLSENITQLMEVNKNMT